MQQLRHMAEKEHEYVCHLLLMPASLQKAVGVMALRAGYNLAKPSYNIGPRQIEHFSIHVVQEGSVLLQYGSHSVTLNQGDLFCLMPHITYRYSIADPARPLRMNWLALDGMQLPELIARAGFTREQPYVRQALDDKLAFILRSLFRLYESEAGGNDSLAGQERRTGHDLQELILLLRLFEHLTRRTASSRPLLGKRPAQDWLHRSREYINLHYMEGITVADAVRHAGIQRSHFSTSFTEHFGISPLHYLQRLRLSKGAQLLRETALSVTEISSTIGYSDLYSFTRAFTKQYGISPSGYRKNSSI